MARRFWSIPGNSQRLDGGAMYGNAPRSLWSRWSEPDDRGRIPLACRAMLVEDEGKRILFEAGIGAFFPPKLRDRFGVQEQDHVLCASLAAIGLTDADIDVVVLSHLHFDHVGGLLEPFAEGQPAALLFPKARFVVSRSAWQRALEPHLRDRVSFIKELQPMLEGTGRLEIVDGDRCDALGPDYPLHFSDGHTPGMMLTEVPSADGAVVFAGDLVPGKPWVHLAITMGYDRYPELLIDEKQALLGDLVSRQGRLFFTHDAETAVCRVTQDDRGRFVPTDPQSTVHDQAL
ncbi:MAG: MBL fold metallo-hydrolase [Deltaproteobacteria bacterium]|nr:MAG: MBL fold metallo-hydrolase [Deltaproteobacteria bacterium]